MKKFLHFSVKNKKLFERSEFFLFRKNVKILASERQPAVFFLFLFLCSDKGKRKAPSDIAEARLSVSEFFSFREIRRFFSFGTGAGSLFSDKSSTTRLFVIFFFLMAERKSKITSRTSPRHIP